jgi:hypothetical protein
MNTSDFTWTQIEPIEIFLPPLGFWAHQELKGAPEAAAFGHCGREKQWAWEGRLPLNRIPRTLPVESGGVEKSVSTQRYCEQIVYSVVTVRQMRFDQA